MGMIVMGFFWVCGGMYGNEELLQAGPPTHPAVAGAAGDIQQRHVGLRIQAVLQGGFPHPVQAS